MKKENKALAKQRREAEKRKKALRKKLTIIGSIILAVALIVGIAVGVKVAQNAADAPVTRNYSKYLTKEGKIKGIDIKDYVELCDLNEALKLNAEDITPTDEDVLAQMKSALSSYETLNTDEGTVLEDGDKINLDYVGYVDGVAFDGGNTNGSGTTLTLGSGSYIDDFEDQLVGAKVGDSVSVEVTFPEVYNNNPDLAGKDAVFEVVINGVYELEITDELIAEKVTGYDTVEAYQESLRQSLYEYNLNQAVWLAISGNSTINEYPEDYTQNLVNMTGYIYQMQYVSANQSIYEVYGQYGWDSMEAYYEQAYGMSADDLESAINYYATLDVVLSMLCQAIYEEVGLSVTEQDKLEFITELGYGEDEMESAVEAYGENYIVQGAINVAVNNYVMSSVIVMAEK